jgi:hypothetical protein
MHWQANVLWSTLHARVADSMLRQGQIKLAIAYGSRSDGPQVWSPNGETLLAWVNHKQAIFDNENMKSPRSGKFTRSCTQLADASHVVAGTIEYKQEATLLRGPYEEMATRTSGKGSKLPDNMGIGRVAKLKDPM